MILKYEDISPYRIKAFGDYQSKKLECEQIFQTIEEASKIAKKGDWLCYISLFDKVLYYTTWKEPIGITSLHLKRGSTIGKWNELTLINKKGEK